MKKVQVPVLGGLRKVIQVGASTSSGTTITGLEGTTLTLTQLASLLGLNTNNGGGNIGNGDNPVITLGPGLSGGGTLVGTIEIRLTAPIGLSGEDGPPGDDGPPGPPGQRGVAGAAGPQGPGLFFLADDGADGDLGPPGPPGPLGATGPQGNAGVPGGVGPAGPVVFFLADDGADGDLGPPGPPGPLGATGNTGPQGPQGPAGTGGGGGPAVVLFPEDYGYPEDIIVPAGSLAWQNAAFHAATVQTTMTIATVGATLGTLYIGGTNASIIATGNTSGLQIQANNSIALGVGATSQNIIIQSGGNVTMLGATAGPVLSLSPAGAHLQGLKIAAGNGDGTTFQSQWTSSSLGPLMGLYQDGSFVVSTAASPGAMGPGTINVGAGYYINKVPLSSTLPLGAYLAADDTTNDDGMCYPIPGNFGPARFNGPASINVGGPSAAMTVSYASGYQGLLFPQAHDVAISLSQTSNVAYTALEWENSVGTGLLAIDTTGGISMGAFSNTPLSLIVNDAATMVLATNSIQGLGPTAAALVDMTPDTGSFIGTITGVAIVTTGTMTWCKMGNLVTMRVGGAGTITSTSNSTALTLTGLPVALRASSAGQFCPCVLEDNGINISGAALVQNSGTISFFSEVISTATLRTAYSATGFTATGQKGLNSTTFTYMLK